MSAPGPSSTHPWRWIPSLYLAQGIPYVVVMTVAVVLYKNLGLSNTDIALYTSWLYLPWVIKPLWSPVVELFGTKRAWIVALQFMLGVAFALVAFTLPGPDFVRCTLAVFWLIAFSSATHDIAADGFYLLALPPHQQAAFVGVRSTFYRIAMISGQGAVVAIAGTLSEKLGDPVRAWMWVFGGLGAVFAVAAMYHMWALPRPAADRAAPREGNARGRAAGGFVAVFVEFFRKPGLGPMLAFLLLYRFAESQLVKLLSPFLLDARETGGLGLSTQAVGLVYGTLGIVALTIGGIAGGVLIARHGLKRMLWPLVVAMNAPNLVYVFLAWTQPESMAVIGAAIVVEQLGYGLGFAAYLVYMMMVAAGPHQTAHYALCTGFMALGMMLPGMPAGWLQERLGYEWFFVWVCVATVPSFVATALIKVDPAFGKKSAAE